MLVALTKQMHLAFLKIHIRSVEPHQLRYTASGTVKDFDDRPFPVRPAGIPDKLHLHSCQWLSHFGLILDRMDLLAWIPGDVSLITAPLQKCIDHKPLAVHCPVGHAMDPLVLVQIDPDIVGCDLADRLVDRQQEVPQVQIIRL